MRRRPPRAHTYRLPARRQGPGGIRLRPAGNQPSRLSALKTFGAHPGMTGDVEHGAVRSLELDLEEAFAVALLLAHEAFGAERLQMLGGLLRIVDQDAEVMHAGVIHPLADLVGLELQHRDVERAVAEEIALGQRTR